MSPGASPTGLRPASTATTAGAGNPVVSLVEDVVSAALTAVAFVLPILAAVVVVAIVAGGAWLVLRLRRRLAR